MVLEVAALVWGSIYMNVSVLGEEAHHFEGLLDLGVAAAFPNPLIVKLSPIWGAAAKGAGSFCVLGWLPSFFHFYISVLLSVLCLHFHLLPMLFLDSVWMELHLVTTSILALEKVPTIGSFICRCVYMNENTYRFELFKAFSVVCDFSEMGGCCECRAGVGAIQYIVVLIAKRLALVRPNSWKVNRPSPEY